MANAINLFDARRSDWTIQGTGKLTPEAQIFLRELWLRGGGAVAQNNNDLAASQFDDAGIAEQLSMLQALGDAGRQSPLHLSIDHQSTDRQQDQLPPMWVDHSRVEYLESQVSQLQAVVAEMQKTISGIQQGVSL